MECRFESWQPFKFNSSFIEVEGLRKLAAENGFDVFEARVESGGFFGETEFSRDGDGGVERFLRVTVISSGGGRRVGLFVHVVVGLLGESL